MLRCDAAMPLCVRLISAAEMFYGCFSIHTLIGRIATSPIGIASAIRRLMDKRFSVRSLMKRDKNGNPLRHWKERLKMPATTMIGCFAMQPMSVHPLPVSKQGPPILQEDIASSPFQVQWPSPRPCRECYMIYDAKQRPRLSDLQVRMTSLHSTAADLAGSAESSVTGQSHHATDVL